MPPALYNSRENTIQIQHRPGFPGCGKVENVAKEAGTERRLAPRRKAPNKGAAILIMPRFEDNRHLLLDCAKLLGKGETAVAYSRLKAGWQRLRRVPVAGYRNLSEFVHHAVLAIETGEFEGSRYILLTAAASFGWAAPNES